MPGSASGSPFPFQCPWCPPDAANPPTTPPEPSCPCGSPVATPVLLFPPWSLPVPLVPWCLPVPWSPCTPRSLLHLLVPPSFQVHTLPNVPQSSQTPPFRLPPPRWVQSPSVPPWPQVPVGVPRRPHSPLAPPVPPGIPVPPSSPRCPPGLRGARAAHPASAPLPLSTLCASDVQMLRHFQRLRRAEGGGGTNRSSPRFSKRKAAKEPATNRSPGLKAMGIHRPPGSHGHRPRRPTAPPRPAPGPALPPPRAPAPPRAPPQASAPPRAPAPPRPTPALPAPPCPGRDAQPRRGGGTNIVPTRESSPRESVGWAAGAAPLPVLAFPASPLHAEVQTRRGSASSRSV